MSVLGPAAVLSHDEVERVLSCSPSRSRYPTTVRNRALLVLLYRAGLRIGEALALRTGDLHLDHDPPRLSVREGKTERSSRVVGLHPEAVAALRAWADLRSSYPGELIFCTMKGTEVSQSYVRHMLARRGARARVPRLHAHAFRATLAVELAKEGVPMPAIRDVLGHANLSVTDCYLRRVFPQDAVDALVNRSGDA